MAEPEKILLTELMARKIEGLAARVRDGSVVGFDLCWNLNQAKAHPTLLCGIMLVAAHNSDDFIDCLEPEADETPEQIQRDVNKILKTEEIQVEDHTTPDALVEDDTGPEVVIEPEDEDYHVIDGSNDDEGGDDDGDK